VKRARPLTPAESFLALWLGAGLAGLILLLVVFRTGADLAPGVTQAGLRQVHSGMSADAVRKLIGEPFEVSRSYDGLERWSYSRDANWALTFPRVWVFIGDAGVDRVLVREQTLWGVDGYAAYFHSDGGTVEYRPNMAGLIP
jgi:hypothetical protein